MGIMADNTKYSGEDFISKTFTACTESFVEVNFYCLYGGINSLRLGGNTVIIERKSSARQR